MQKRYEKTFSIGDASRMSGGVNQRKLRAWGGKYIPEPERLICGERAYRRYTMREIELIRKINEYQCEGYTLKAAANKAAEDMARKGGAGK